MTADESLDRGTKLRTVQRALEVLEIVATSRERLQVRGVSQALNHNLSSTYHIVNTLLAEGYLDRRADGTLGIGGKIGMLNEALVRGYELLELARPIVEDLASSTGETVYLTRFTGRAAVIQLVIESDHSLRVSGLAVGYSGNEDRRASGRAILAHVDNERLTETLTASIGGEEPAGLDKRIRYAHKAIDEVRAAGFAFDDEEFETGVSCVAAAYFASNGTVAGSVALSAPSVRAGKMTGEFKDEVVRTAGRITQALRT
ncbi:MAG: IclR family transcriptional regulator [Salinibacterium sp.]|nr:IclR family transcriptional regulator [Salinibacterium sp.]